MLCNLNKKQIRVLKVIKYGRSILEIKSILEASTKGVEGPQEFSNLDLTFRPE